MKKVLSLVLALVITVLMIPVSVMAADTGSVSSDYTPSPIAQPVSTVAEFEAMKDGNEYYLTKDIDFGGKAYSGYVIKNPNFILDGCGHSITGIKINVGTDIKAGGLFGEPFAGTVIKNLVVGSDAAPISVEGGTGATGGLFQAVKKKLTVENVKIYANINCGPSAGGFIGYVSTSELNLVNCEFNGTLNSSDGSSGGIIGYLKQSSKIRVENCVNNGTLVSKATKDSSIGGIVGYTNTAIDIIGCVNNGSVTTDTPFAGGILGMIDTQIAGDTVNIKNCVNNGKISGTKTGKTSDGDYSKDVTVNAGIGGIFGATRHFEWNKDNTLNIEGCMNYGEIVTNGASGGAIMGKAVKSTDDSAVFKINVKNCGNLGKITYGNTTDTFGSFVSVAETSGTASLVISNCFNAGTTTSTKALAGVYNLTGSATKGDTSVSDFYYLSSSFTNVANTLNVKVANAVPCTPAQFSSGEVAFALGFAFGQQLGVDSYPAVNGPAVAQFDGQYVNVNTISTDTDGSAMSFVQMTEAVEGKQSVRFVIAVDGAKIDSAANVEMTIVFKKAGAQDVSYTLKTGDVKLFKSIVADSVVYMGANGVVLIGAAVNGVVASEWDSTRIDLTIKDEGGAAIPELCASATYTK